MNVKSTTQFSGSVAHAVAPSNIAFVKYWGKRDAAQQWPANDSLSMTLSSARTETRAQISQDGKDSISLRGGTFSPEQERKALRHIAFLRDRSGFAAPLRIETWNSFPTSAGIASSASGFAALTIGALGAWTGTTSLAHLAESGFGRDRLADLARYGSGSACRSVFGGFVRWSAGDSPLSQKVDVLESNEHWNLSDLVVILSDKPKSIGSTEAHAFAATSPLFAPRLAALSERQSLIQRAIKTCDLPSLGREIEAEALDMHAVMMTALPSVSYMSESSQKVLVGIRKARATHGLPAYFTMDAGPNVHVICETKNRATVTTALHEIAKEFLADSAYSILEDQIGSGPTLSRAEV